MSTQKCALLVVLALAGAGQASWGEEFQIQGRIEDVTVYRGQALVTRVVDLPPPGGLREVVVTGLPDRIVPGSIHAESGDGAVVRSVRYRVRPVSEDVREEVRRLDTQIREADDGLQTNARRKGLITEHRAYLTQLEQFSAPLASMELTHGVLNADTIKILTTFLFEQRERLTTEELGLVRDERALREKLELLQRERAELTGGTARTVREAVVFVDLQRAEGTALRVRYIVDGANWFPSYNVRAGADRGTVLLEYQASIQQMSGEDWSDVSMTLSTATPSLVAKAPPLTPLTLAVGRAAEGQKAMGKGDYAKAHQELGQLRRLAESNRNEFVMQQSQSMEAQPMAAINLDAGRNDLVLNRAAGDMQLLDLVTSERISKGEAATGDEGVSVTYRLPDKTTLPSRSDRQLIQIAALPVKGEFYKVAMPVLTEFVYDEAVLTNDTNMVLLAGPLSAYMAGQFVGHGDIPTVVAGENFTVGFGIDSSLRAARELVSRHESIQGGNRVVVFKYRLAVQNFGAQPASIRLLDRLPTARESEIKITLEPTRPELSSDKAYQSKQRSKGILRWDTQVPAQSAGAEPLTIEYEFHMEYDKEMSITGLEMPTG